MKILVIFSVSILLVSILFCPVVRAAPPIPEEFKIVAPDPSLPKELRAFFGKYEGSNGPIRLFVIVAQIDKEKATLHIWREGPPGIYDRQFGWETTNAEVFKERGEYQLWFRSSRDMGAGSIEARIDGKYLKVTSHNGLFRLARVEESAVSLPLPDDLKMVQPDPSLPKELAAFFGKWEGVDRNAQFIFIVEKIDREKASLYIYRSAPTESLGAGWQRIEGTVVKEGPNYKISFRRTHGRVDLTLKGEYLESYMFPTWSVRFRRLQ